jgi:hypothetical protein
MVRRLIIQSRANGGKGKISNWICDEHATTDKDSKKNPTMVEASDGAGDNREISGERENEKADGMNMDDVPEERGGSRRDGKGKSEDWHLDGKRRGHGPQTKGTHTSNEESATVTISEDSQGTNKEEQEGNEERASGEDNNTGDENRSREANGNEKPTQPALPAGTKEGDRKITKCRKATITIRAEVERTGTTAKRTEGKRTTDHRKDEKETA